MPQYTAGALELTGGAVGSCAAPDEMGVRFIATADAHFLDGGWVPSTHHDEAEGSSTVSRAAPDKVSL